MLKRNEIIDSVMLFVVHFRTNEHGARDQVSSPLGAFSETMANLKRIFEIGSFSTVPFKVNKTKTRVCEKKRGSERKIEREKRRRERESKETEENDLTFKHGRV